VPVGFVESMLAVSVLGKLSEPNPPWLSRSLPNFPVYNQWGANNIQWHCYVSVVFNQFSIATCNVQVASDILIVLMLRPIHHHMDFLFLGVNTVLLNFKAAKANCLIGSGKLCTFGIGAMFH
jgi:hypothetical protein